MDHCVLVSTDQVYELPFLHTTFGSRFEDLFTYMHC